MGVFEVVVADLLFFITAFIFSVGAYKLYNILPLAIFMERNTSLEEMPDPRIKKIRETVLFCFSLGFLSFVFYIQNDISILLFCNVFSLLFLIYVFTADIKTRIIPDQFVFALVFISLFWILNDISNITTTGFRIYTIPLNRFIGGIIGGGILFVINFIGTKILKQSTMGMGDVKLMFACGLITGPAGIVIVLVLSFLTALPFAAYKYFLEKKQSGSLVSGKNKFTPANSIAFGPFIASGTILFLVFPKEFIMIAHWWLGL